MPRHASQDLEHGQIDGGVKVGMPQRRQKRREFGVAAVEKQGHIVCGVKVAINKQW